MYTVKRVIKHVGWRLMLRNPEFDRRPSEKQKVARFIKSGLFASRDMAHDYIRRNHPSYTSKDYRIVGVKVDYTPNDYAKPSDSKPAKSAAEKMVK